MECRMAGKGNASPQPAEHHRKTSSTPEGASVPLFGRGREFFALGEVRNARHLPADWYLPTFLLLTIFTEILHFVQNDDEGGKGST
jgi:hypothetical protein